jgi:hypothetical protein
LGTSARVCRITQIKITGLYKDDLMFLKDKMTHRKQKEECPQCLFLLTLLLSYSFLEAAKSWALDMAIPQNGRYICMTWVKESIKSIKTSIPALKSHFLSMPNWSTFFSAIGTEHRAVDTS